MLSGSFTNFYSETDVYTYIKSTVGPALLIDDTGSTTTSSTYLNSLSKFIGPIYIRQVRTKKTS